MGFMTSTAFTTKVPADRVDELRRLLAELNEDVSGLVERARAVGYHRERMWLQTNADGDAQLIVYLELNDEKSSREVMAGISAYENEFTRWWGPRFRAFLPGSAGTCETLFAWDDRT